MTKVICPCKSCTNRSLACHDRCPKYLVYREQNRRKKIRLKEEQVQSYAELLTYIALKKDSRKKSYSRKR